MGRLSSVQPSAFSSGNSNNLCGSMVSNSILKSSSTQQYSHSSGFSLARSNGSGNLQKKWFAAWYGWKVSPCAKFDKLFWNKANDQDLENFTKMRSLSRSSKYFWHKQVKRKIFIQVEINHNYLTWSWNKNRLFYRASLRRCVSYWSKFIHRSEYRCFLLNQLIQRPKCQTKSSF